VVGSQNCSSGVADQKEALAAWANHLLAILREKMNLSIKKKNVSQLLQCSAFKNDSHTDVRRPPCLTPSNVLQKCSASMA
jgi:hypothetical protein